MLTDLCSLQDYGIEDNSLLRLKTEPLSIPLSNSSLAVLSHFQHISMIQFSRSRKEFSVVLV